MSKIFKWAGILFLASIAFVVIVIILAVALGSSNKTSSSNSSKIGDLTSSTSIASEVSSESSSLAETYKVGDIIKVSDYTFTLNKVDDNVQSGNQFIKPKDGNKFMKVTLTIENNGQQKTSISTILQMYLKDGEGNKYQQTFLVDQKQIDGELLAGDKIKGELAYEVPVASSGLKFYYNADWLSSKSIIIDLGI